jgi:hypothetical protein
VRLAPHRQFLVGAFLARVPRRAVEVHDPSVVVYVAALLLAGEEVGELYSVALDAPGPILLALGAALVVPLMLLPPRAFTMGSALSGT